MTWISKQSRSVLLLGALVAPVLLMPVAPSLPITMLVGLALAVVIFVFGFVDVRLRTRS